MKLSFWNWVHLLAPYFIALLCYKLEEGFLGWLFAGYFLTEIITMAPYMNREVKTGRSFKTKYGRIEEYHTIKGESGNDMENMTGKIHVAHFLGMILIIIYAIYSIFSSINADKSNTAGLDILNKAEDTLTTVTPEYYSNTNASEFNEEDSTNVNNEKIDSTEYIDETNINSSNNDNSNSLQAKPKYRVYNLGYSTNYNEAEAECRTRKMRLPDYNELLEISNSPELLKNLKPNDKSQSYWSSTDYIDGQPFSNKESIQGDDLKNYKKNYNPYTDKTIMTDTRLTKNCICIEKSNDSNNYELTN